MSKKIWRLSLLILFVVLMTGCTLPWKKKPAPIPGNPNPSGVASSSSEAAVSATNNVKKFNNYAELKKFLQDNSTGGGSSYSRGMMEMVSMGDTVPSANLAVGAGSKAASAPAAEDNQAATPNTDYSSTNNQVAGVDEADIIKTDGNYVYALVRNELFIIKAVPATSTQIISKITFADRPQDILIDGQNLAVFGADNQLYAQSVYRSFRRQNPYTFFKVFDLKDPARPQQVRDLEFEGNYRDARLIGDYVYIITNTYSGYLIDDVVVPRVIENGKILAQDCSGGKRCYAPDVYYFDRPYDSFSYTGIKAINIKNNGEAINGQEYLMEANQNLYVSANNIYLTYTQYLSEYDLEQDVKRQLVYPQLSADDQNKIAQIEAAPGFILSRSEKRSKVAQTIEQYLSALPSESQTAWQTKIDEALKQELVAKAAELEKTVIHKIGISGGLIEYRAKGEVSGQILNQFSMDEKGNYFRLATTRNRQWSRLSEQSSDSYSNIYILDSELKTIGRLENLATTERIYAARFFGDRLYLVTFRQTDPLYAISLVDPYKPEVLGAIKVPGYSNYLHPVDASGAKLIGFGRDADVDSDGRTKIKGLKLSLFDFSDLSKPRELDTYIIGDSSSDSIALSDHHAFLYAPTKKLLVIPATWRDTLSQTNFAGALVFSMENDRFILKGKLDHSAGGKYNAPDYWGGFSYYDNSVKRSFYIGDNLYTFSNKFLKTNSLGDLSELKSLVLTPGGDDYIISPGGDESGPLPVPISSDSGFFVPSGKIK